MPNDKVCLQSSKTKNYPSNCAYLHGMDEPVQVFEVKKIPLRFMHLKYFCALLHMYFRRNLYMSTSLAELVYIKNRYKSTCCEVQHSNTEICSAWIYLHSCYVVQRSLSL